MKNPAKVYFEWLETKKELQEEIATLIEKSKFSVNFGVMTLISAVIATLGLIMGSTSILIGAMLIAPLLMPIIGLSVGIGALNIKLITHSLKSTLGGLIGALGGAILISYIFKNSIDSTAEINTLAEHITMYATIACLAGFSATFSWFKKGTAEILPGVAISVALMPPIALAGILFTLKNETQLTQALEVVLINLVGIFLGGWVAFMLLQMKNPKQPKTVYKDIEKEIQKK